MYYEALKGAKNNSLGIIIFDAKNDKESKRTRKMMIMPDLGIREGQRFEK